MSKFYAGEKVEVQRVKKALLEATKETKDSKEFHARKKAIKQNSTQNAKRRGMPQRKYKYCDTLYEQEDVQSMIRTVLDEAEQIILSECAEPQAQE